MFSSAKYFDLRNSGGKRSVDIASIAALLIEALAFSEFTSGEMWMTNNERKLLDAFYCQKFPRFNPDMKLQ